ncbi:MAG TPA: bifunctional 3,4-dihydroxy-2-butanone-4-phosphate synthase/GTP cyclohydrolase II [bacterium]|nr:bifunctional 3,4-dihydroxy-2-butanone-4-phosphate synthase/GTP cyclohydrolase II [bacterium]HQL62840.1 bifunctional 3,4-dihydroxy-2-butanone-4-phosphate synthase/GTP cyclohydrolase II [bacterium]
MIRSPFLSIPEAIKDLQSGKILIVVDDENRENEGDMIAAASLTTPEMVNFITREARGLLCVSMTRERLDRLQLPPMVYENTAVHGTAFHVTVDALKGTTTGISASDRAITIRALADPETKPEDLGRPGHISPLCAATGGVLRRWGHTEAAVDLMRLAGLPPVALLCEIMDDDGTMARMPALERLAERHGLGIVTIPSIIEYRHKTEKLVKKELVTHLPTEFGEFDLHLYSCAVDDKDYLALVKGDVTIGEPVLVRVHSRCLTGDVLGSLRCDCRAQIAYALRLIEKEGRGVLLYMPQEGRGIGLRNKLRAYVLQDQGLDTVDANLELGFKEDQRDYGIGSQILADLGIKKLRVLTNNPKKLIGLEGYGLEIVERVPVEVGCTEHNLKYIQTKKNRMGHLFNQEIKPVERSRGAE